MSQKSRFSRYLSLVTLTATLIGGSLVAGSPAQAYPPGKATVVSLSDYSTGTFHFTCKFTNWRSDAKVITRCDLYGWTAGAGYVLLHKNESSWTPPPSSKTRSYSGRVSIGSGNICVRARAYSVDGSADSGYQKCRFGL